MSTLLPTPDAPMMKKTSPGFTSKLTSSRTLLGPKDFLMLRNWIKAKIVASSSAGAGGARLARDGARAAPARVHALGAGLAVEGAAAAGAGVVAVRAGLAAHLTAAARTGEDGTGVRLGDEHASAALAVGAADERGTGLARARSRRRLRARGLRARRPTRPGGRSAGTPGG